MKLNCTMHKLETVHSQNRNAPVTMDLLWLMNSIHAVVFIYITSTYMHKLVLGKKEMKASVSQ